MSSQSTGQSKPDVKVIEQVTNRNEANEMLPEQEYNVKKQPEQSQNKAVPAKRPVKEGIEFWTTQYQQQQEKLKQTFRSGKQKTAATHKQQQSIPNGGDQNVTALLLELQTASGKAVQNGDIVPNTALLITPQQQKQQSKFSENVAQNTAHSQHQLLRETRNSTLYENKQYKKSQQETRQHERTSKPNQDGQETPSPGDEPIAPILPQREDTDKRPLPPREQSSAESQQADLRKISSQTDSSKAGARQEQHDVLKNPSTIGCYKSEQHAKSTLVTQPADNGSKRNITMPGPQQNKSETLAPSNTTSLQLPKGNFSTNTRGGQPNTVTTTKQQNNVTTTARYMGNKSNPATTVSLQQNNCEMTTPINNPNTVLLQQQGHELTTVTPVDKPNTTSLQHPKDQLYTTACGYKPSTVTTIQRNNVKVIARSTGNNSTPVTAVPNVQETLKQPMKMETTIDGDEPISTIKRGDKPNVQVSQKQPIKLETAIDGDEPMATLKRYDETDVPALQKQPIKLETAIDGDKPITTMKRGDKANVPSLQKQPMKRETTFNGDEPTTNTSSQQQKKQGILPQHECKWVEPYCLVETGADGKLVVNQSTVERMSQSARPAVVVGIAGFYRTGKSYLLSKLAQQNLPGFSLGDTTQAKTKGIWAWIVPHPRRSDWQLVLLDTEGLSDVEKGDVNHDSWIFTLTTLLSGVLVYNSVGTIDHDAIKQLHFITQLAKRVQSRAVTNEVEDEDTLIAELEMTENLPSFVWVVRDFTLQLIADGKQISQDEYLERALNMKKGYSKAIIDYNLPRKCIRSYFPSRKCFTFQAPTNDNELLSSLSQVPDEKLNAGFVKSLHTMKNYIYTHERPKRVNGRQINGRMLADLCCAYVDSIKNGAVPNILSALQLSINAEMEKAMQECLKSYRDTIHKMVQVPVETIENLLTAHQQCHDKATKTFLQKTSLLDEEIPYAWTFQEMLKKEYQDVIIMHEKASRQRCHSTLSQLYRNIGVKVKNGEYAVPGGHHRYKADMESLTKGYNNTNKKGLCADEVLRKFMEDHAVDDKSILMADTQLTESMKRTEAEQAELMRQRQQLEAACEEQRREEQRLRDEMKSQEEYLRQLEKRWQDQQEEMIKGKQKLIESRRAEKNRLKKEGLVDDVDAVDDELRHLEQEVKETQSKQTRGFREMFPK